MNKRLLILLFSIGLFTSGVSMAGNINDDLSIVKSGTVVCGKGDIRVRNINGSARLYTVQITLYDRLGATIYDSSIDGFPSDYKRTLQGRQSTLLSEASVFGLVTTADSGGPWQTWITFKNLKADVWEATRALPPKVGGVKVHTDDTDAVLGYHSFSCNYQSATR